MNQSKKHIKSLGVIFYILVAALFWSAGCATQPHPDPLAGWKPLFGRDYEQVDKATMSDYQDYIQKLPDEERIRVGPIFLFEDETGQHAVEIKIGLNGTSWEHVLIYDKDNKRIKTVKYVSGNYAS